MEKRRKVIVTILSIIMIVLTAILGYSIMSKVNKINSQIHDIGLSNGNINNKSKTIEGITFESVSVEYDKLNVVARVKVKNNSNEFKKNSYYRIYFLDRNGKEIYDKRVDLPEMRKNKELMIELDLSKDIINRYYDFRVERIK